MARPSITVVRVSAEDVRDLTQLWLAAAVAGGMSPEVASRTANDSRISTALRRTRTRAFVAHQDGVPAGYAVLDIGPRGLVDPPSVVVDELYVLPDQRRRGVGRALLTAVATCAEQEASEFVLCNVVATDKVANRYFARLGFGAPVTRRIIPTTGLRRRLSAVDTSVDLLLGRRRTLRARARQAGPTGATPRFVGALSRPVG